LATFLPLEFAEKWQQLATQTHQYLVKSYLVVTLAMGLSGK